jgi:hypothetical protein
MMLWFTLAAHLLCPSAGTGQDWAGADVATTRLRPAAFPDLPVAVRKDLERRGCTVPQSFAAARAENVARGRFTSATGRDWAVLCSVARVSTILVFRGGTVPAVAELGRSPDSNFLQAVDDHGAVGYSRAIAVADARMIRAHNRDNPDLPRLDHDGINDIFVEKASTIWYWYRGRWLGLSGVD